jgi:hypothetical protein
MFRQKRKSPMNKEKKSTKNKRKKTSSSHQLERDGALRIAKTKHSK